MTTVVVVGVVVLAITGALGLRTATASQHDGDLSVEVSHASVSRPGLPTPLTITVATVDGSALPAELTVEIPRSYLDLFDENGLAPEPDAVASDGFTETWTYSTAGESILSIDFDARLQPNAQWGIQRGWITVSAQDAGAAVRVDFETRVMP